MSVHHINRNAAAADPFKIEDVIALLSAMVRAYDNPDAPDERGAIDAAREGRPAYWSTQKYHHQLARLFVGWANRKEGLSAAVDQWASARHPENDRSALALLDTLVPLNGAAIRELSEFRCTAALAAMTLSHASGRLQAAE